MSESLTIWEGQSGALETTLAIGAAVARLARAGDVIALNGELGAGKTQFVRGLADGLGIGRRAVSSPTFVLAQEYDAATPGGLRLVHIDAYRLDGDLDAESIGLDGGEDMRHGAVVAVEWAERLGDVLGADRLVVTIEHEDADTRRIAMSTHGSWAEREADLIAALNAIDKQTENAEVNLMAKGEQDMQNGKASAIGLNGTDATQAIESPSSKSIQTPCPICEKDALSTEATYPFCSQRCKNVDLGRWLDGAYIISRPIEQDDLEQDD